MLKVFQTPIEKTPIEQTPIDETPKEAIKPIDASRQTGFIQIKQDTIDTTPKEVVDQPIFISPRPIPTTFQVTCSITVPKTIEYPDIDPKDC